MSQPAHFDGMIILGHPRSGTTLLRRLLDAHSQIACPGETHILSACARFLKSEKTADGLDLGVLAGLNYAGFADDIVLERLRNFAFSFPREYAKNEGKSRWAEKTAFDSYHIDDIDKLCGDHAYFVGIVRHGLDVIVSCSDFVDHAGSYIGGLHSYIKKYPQPMLAFAHSWADVNRSLFEFGERHPDNCIIVRYEDLIDDPAATLTALLEFVGESFESETITNGLSKVGSLGFSDHKSFEKSRIEQTSVGRWHDLPQSQLHELASIVNPLLELCDYETVEASEPASLDESRKRYNMTLMVRAARARQKEN